MTTRSLVPAVGPWRIVADSVFVALGNEPFWNVRVTAREILYRDPEHQDGYRFPPVNAFIEGDGAPSALAMKASEPMVETPHV